MTIVTATSLGAWAGISDNEDDPNLQIAANAANSAVTRYCGRTFETTTSASASARTFRPKNWTVCYTDDFHTTDGLVVKIDDGDDGTYETTLALNTDFILEPLNGREDGLSVPYRKIVTDTWLFPQCSTRPSVQVTAAWGWASVPDDVTLAALIWGHRYFKRRQSPEGFAGGFQDFAARISRSIDPDVTDLLHVYRTAEVQLYA